jgi:U3 small nucleolar RNA-associated protein 22
MPKVKSAIKEKAGNRRKSAPKVARMSSSPSVEGGEFVDPMIDIQSEGSEEDFAGDMETDDGSIDDDDEVGVMDDDDEEVTMAEEELDDDMDEPEAGPSKPKQTHGKHRDLYAPPTLDELDSLSSTSSASFTLQLSALLSSTLLPVTPHSTLKTLLTSLHSTINSIPSVDPLSPKEGLKKVGCPSTISPVEFVPRKVNWTVGFDNPMEVFVSGSWSVAGGYRTGKGEQGGVDMVLVMPEVSLLSLNRHSGMLMGSGAIDPERSIGLPIFLQEGILPWRRQDCFGKS